MCFLINSEESVDYHLLASALLDHAFPYLTGAYQTSLNHVRRTIELCPDDLDLKRALLFYHDMPLELVSDQEAQEVRRLVSAQMKTKSVMDKNKLAELFESEPKIIGDDLSGVYSYDRKDEYGFTLIMHFFISEKHCSLSLWYKDFKKPIFDIGFDKISAIKCKENKLIIQQTDNPKNIVVYFKPHYALTFEEQST